MRFVPQQIPIDPQSKWELILTKNLRERGDYLKKEQEIIYQQVAGMFLGSFEDQESFKEYLYLLAHEESNGFECLFQGMNREIDNKHFQEIQRILNIHAKENLSINRFIAFMEGAGLFPFRNEPFYSYYRLIVKQVIELFEKRYGNLSVPIFRRVIVDIVKWSWNYLDKWGKSYHFEERMPRILWYGNAKESEVYFLYLLYLFGCDVIVFHPEGTNIFSILAENTIPEVKYPVNVTLFNFPIQKPNRRTTVAQRASEELDKVLYNESSNLYRPWQFRDYIPTPITLKTTYDELFILQPEKAMYRHGFHAVKPTIEIPTLFSKIVGMTKDRGEYWGRIEQISSNRLTHTVTQFPLVSRYKGNMRFHYREVLDGDKISADKLIAQSFWPYTNLATSFQKGLAQVISRFVSQSEISNIPQESEEAKRWYLFGQAMMIPESLIQLFQQFDYAQEVPTLLLFNNGKSGTFTREDATLINLLNEMGFDIFLFNPTGQNDIESFLDPKHYDVHWLEDLSFDEVFNHTTNLMGKKSKFKSIFKNLFK